MSEPFVYDIHRLEARVDPAPWGWAQENSTLIAAHWQKVGAGRTGFYDGRVLLRRARQRADDTLRLTYMEADFSAFMAARDLGWPGDGSGNAFAMAALETADGAFILGEMAGHTANAGRIYFPAGTPDRGDIVAGGLVDLAGSALRELEEETGLTPGDVEVGGWTVVEYGWRIALMRAMRSSLPAEALCERIAAFLAQDARPELARMHIVRGPQDLEDPRIAAETRAYIARRFSES